MTDKIFFEETSSGMFVKKFLADKTFEEMDDLKNRHLAEWMLRKCR